VNPRQRRGVLFILLSAALAVAVFFVVATYVGNVQSQVGSVVTVYRAADDLPAYAVLDESSITSDEVPARWLSDTARVTADDLVGRRIGFNVAQGTLLSADMLVPASDLSPTEREIAIQVNQITGVADRVRPGDFVDIYAVFADVPGLPKQVRVLVKNVRVVSVRGSQVRFDEESATGGQAVTYAAAFAQEVRLVGLPTGTGEDRTGEQDDFDAEDLGGVTVPEGNVG
jgi:pilus assembly protein CpaB